MNHHEGGNKTRNAKEASEKNKELGAPLFDSLFGILELVALVLWMFSELFDKHGQFNLQALFLWLAICFFLSGAAHLASKCLRGSKAVWIIYFFLCIILALCVVAYTRPETKTNPKQRWFTKKVVGGINIDIGSNSSGFSDEYLSKNALIFNDAGVQIKARLKNGLLYFDADLFWKGTEDSVHIIQNEIQNLPPQWQVNCDESGVEIVNEKIMPVLQIVFTGDNTAVLRGIFQARNYAEVLTDEGIFGFPTSPQLDITNAPIKRLFKYPAYRYNGQREQ